MKAFGFPLRKTQKKFFDMPNNQKPKTKQNVIFRASPILSIFLRKFLGLVLGCVGLIDAKSIGVAQPIWS